ncbi:HotDog domain-containing protein [Aspergillus granulosus]|uniref:HotDog domain-containing protein n=1 Tax=Aspergillus granulosus TaxID=176169 RepID=A0ABR4H7I9_9EURO
MQSRTVGPFLAHLSRRPPFYCSRAPERFFLNECLYNGVHQYAARQAQFKQSCCEQKPLYRGVRHLSSAPAFGGIDSQTQQTAEDLIASLPIIRYLRSPEPSYTESRPYRDMHPAAHTTHLVSASLLGPSRLPTDPIFFLQTHPVCKIIATCYIGKDICGHPGYVHGGLSFVLLDDIFARCAAVVFKSRIGMTASMSVDFRDPAVPDRVYVYRAEIVRLEGRKVWVAGQMRSLRSFTADEMARREVAGDDGQSVEELEGTLVAEAKALFVEPKNTEAMVHLYPA